LIIGGRRAMRKIIQMQLFKTNFIVVRIYSIILILSILISVAFPDDTAKKIKISVLDFLYVCDGGYDPQYSFEKNIEKHILMPELAHTLKNFDLTNFDVQAKQITHGRLDYYQSLDENTYNNRSLYSDYDLLIWGVVVPTDWPDNYKLNLFVFTKSTDFGLSGISVTLLISRGRIIEWNDQKCNLREKTITVLPAILGYKLAKGNITFQRDATNAEINKEIRRLINKSQIELPPYILDNILRWKPSKTDVYGSLELNLLQNEYLIFNLTKSIVRQIEEVNLLNKPLNWALEQSGLVMPEISITSENSIEKAEINDFDVTKTQNEILIGILPFENVNRPVKDDWLGFGLKYLIANKLSAISNLNVLDTDIIETALIDSGYKKYVLNNAGLEKISTTTGFNVAISGTYATSANEIEVNLDYINMVDSITISSYRYQENMDDLFNIADDITEDFLKLSNTSVAQDEEILLDHHLTNSIKAFEYFCMGYLENDKENKNLDLIIDYFKKAIAQDPQFWEAQYNLGIAYYNNKNYYRALNQFDKLIDVVPGFEKPYLGRGLTFIRLNDFNKAENDFLYVIELKPGYYKPYYYLGKINVKLERFDTAKNYLKKALDLNPAYGNTYFEIGNLYFTQHNFNLARPYFKRAVELTPFNLKAHQKLGECLYHAHNFKEAIREFEIILKEDPGDSEANFMLGITVYKQAVLDDFIDAFLEMFSITMPNKVKTEQQDNALKNKRMDVYKLMIKHFFNAYQARNNFYEATFNLALTYQEMGKIDSAMVYYDKTLAINPRLAKAHLMLIKLYEAQGEDDKALENYKMVVRTEPSYFVTYPNLGKTYNNLNIVDVVVQELEQEIRDDPHNIEANLSLARIFHIQGYHGKAAHIYRNVLKIAPDNKRAKQMLAQLER